MTTIDIDDHMIVDDLSDADKVIGDMLTSENGERDLSDDKQDDLKRGGYFLLVTGDGYGGEMAMDMMEKIFLVY